MGLSSDSLQCAGQVHLNHHEGKFLEQMNGMHRKSSFKGVYSRLSEAKARERLALI